MTISLSGFILIRKSSLDLVDFDDFLIRRTLLIDFLFTLPQSPQTYLLGLSPIFLRYLGFLCLSSVLLSSPFRGPDRRAPFSLSLSFPLHIPPGGLYLAPLVALPMTTAMPRCNTPDRPRIMQPYTPALTGSPLLPPPLPLRRQRLARTQSVRAPVQLNVLLFNVHGLTLLKWQTLKLVATNHKAHVIVLTETHLGVTPPPYIIHHHSSSLFFGGPLKTGTSFYRGGVAVICLDDDYALERTIPGSAY
jgi:hypothetical protein